MFALVGSHALVTGAASGIGAAVTRELAAAGVSVYAIDRDEPGLHAVIRSTPEPTRHIAAVCDLSDPECGRLVSEAAEHLGGLEMLVNAAAVLIRSPSVEEIDIQAWQLQVDVNLRATLLLSSAAAGVMRARGSGRIVNLASQAWATGGLDDSLVYAATKGGVVSLTRGLARSLAGSGVTVNAVAPGLVETPMLIGSLSAEQVEHMARDLPLGRLAGPEEISAAIVFLLSERAGYITGATLDLSGGMLMH